MNCPRCGAPASSLTAKFCEECGAALSEHIPPDAGCAHCGSGPEAIDDAGYCTLCGLERHRATERDHWEVICSSGLAGVCDLGRKRLRNEDFLALAEEGAARIAVVCDGVSQSRDAGAAASAAAPLVCQLLREASRATTTDGIENAMKEALLAAHRAVASLAPKGQVSEDAPAATIVAAWVLGHEIVLGWLGDCRAYWLAPGEARLLTKDHSWINEIVDAGKLTYAEACRRKGAHAVTRSLGGPSAAIADVTVGDEPSVARVTLSGPGWLLLCSDGLWGYTPEPAELSIWLTEANHHGLEAVALSRALVERARLCGGRDNITAALIRLANSS